MRTVVAKWARQCLAWGRTFHTVEAIEQFVNVLDKHSRRQVGDKCGEDLRTECEAESKPHGTACLFRHIPLGVVKSAGKK
jgi:hypothetical protein